MVQKPTFPRRGEIPRSARNDRGARRGMCAKGGEATIPFACVRGRERAKPKEPTQEQGMHGAEKGRQAGRQTTSIPLAPLRKRRGNLPPSFPRRRESRGEGVNLPFLRMQKGDAASAARRRGFTHSRGLNPLVFPLGHQGGGMRRHHAHHFPITAIMVQPSPVDSRLRGNDAGCTQESRGEKAPSPSQSARGRERAKPKEPTQEQGMKGGNHAHHSKSCPSQFINASPKLRINSAGGRLTSVIGVASMATHHKGAK